MAAVNISARPARLTSVPVHPDPTMSRASAFPAQRWLFQGFMYQKILKKTDWLVSLLPYAELEGENSGALVSMLQTTHNVHNSQNSQQVQNDGTSIAKCSNLLLDENTSSL